MAILLSIETSTSVCSVALHRQGELVSFEENHIPQSTAAQLAIMIERTLATARVSAQALNGVAVACGPGSYTGLRIGVATAKGLCYALAVPLIAINTLELMVHQVTRAFHFSPGDLLCPMLDARRMEVYCLLMDENHQLVQPTQAKIVDENSFAQELNQARIHFFGDGAAKCRQVIQHPNAMFLDKVTPSAQALGNLAYRQWQRQAFESLADFEPFYLKDFLIKKPNGEQ